MAVFANSPCCGLIWVSADQLGRTTVSGNDLVFTVEMALRKASRSLPRKRGRGDHIRLKQLAAFVAAHLERAYRWPPPRDSTRAPYAAHGQSDGVDGPYSA